jgi:membrane-anchored glycerophosphoryl diester phosphodiesterase (GDPDase)
VPRYTLPLIITKNQTIKNAHDCLQKTVLNHIRTMSGIPRVHSS